MVLEFVLHSLSSIHTLYTVSHCSHNKEESFTAWCVFPTKKLSEQSASDCNIISLETTAAYCNQQEVNTPEHAVL